MAFQPNVTSFSLPAPSSAAYCNGVQITISEWDVTCMFFHSVPVPGGGPGEEANVERRLVHGVVMSPQHAKALALVLGRNVENWEARFGAIALPADIVARSTAEEGSIDVT